MLESCQQMPGAVDAAAGFFCGSFVHFVGWQNTERIASMTSPPPHTTDTSPEAHAVQLELLRRMSPEERFRKAYALTRRCRKMARDAIRRRYPGVGEDELRLRFIELVYGRELADEVRRWQEGRR